MPESQPETSARGLLAAVALFLGGFVLAALLLHLTVRNPLYLHADVRSEKLVMLGKLQGSVFSAAFGSSHVHNGFDPHTFDAELGTTIPTHTVNLAVEGGSQAEQRVLALEFLRHVQAPPRGTSCMVLLEVNAGANFLGNFLVHPRTIDIYDWRTTHFISQLTSPQMPRAQRLGRTGYALTAMGLHYANIGMISNRIFAPPLNDEMVADNLRDDHRGLMVLGAGSKELPHELDAQPRTTQREPGTLTGGNTALLTELQASSPVPNLAFVYFVFPKFSDLTAAPEYPDHLSANGRDVPIINMAQPARFPELYKIQYWHDDAHLNGAGAALLSRLFADEIKAWYAAHGGAPTCSS